MNSQGLSGVFYIGEDFYAVSEEMVLILYHDFDSSVCVTDTSYCVCRHETGQHHYM